MDLNMIEIILSAKEYENDVYPLAKAFYPERVIKVYSTEEYAKAKNASKVGDVLEGKSHNNGEASFQCIHRMHIDFTAERIGITVFRQAAEGSYFQANTGIYRELTKQYKNELKRLLYGVLSKDTKKVLPWGILTGIRPTKLVYEMLEQGYAESDIRKNMIEDYLCSEEKISLSIQIAKRELELLKELDYRKGYSIYIGIPFCPSTCLYCSFPSYSIQKFSEYVEKYLDALEKELLYGATCFTEKKLTTVYIGGGTPTTLSAKQLDRLLGLIRRHYDFKYVKEFCVEAGRPDSITREKLLTLKKWGVNRISINPQSMQQRTLELIGREHTVEQIKEAFVMARETGHDNINMDIIIGLPGESTADIEDTLSQIKELGPEGLTVHTLAVKRAARLRQERESYQDMSASDVTGMMKAAFRFAKENAYLPYYLYRQKNMADNLENIGYAKDNREGLYNILIMEEQQTILAFGAGALSKFVFHEEHRIERVDNVKSVTDYISRIDEMILRKQQFIKNNPNI